MYLHWKVRGTGDDHNYYPFELHSVVALFAFWLGSQLNWPLRLIVGPATLEQAGCRLHLRAGTLAWTRSQ